MRVTLIVAAMLTTLCACPSPPLPEPPVVEVVTGDYPEPPEYRVIEHVDGSEAAAASPCGLACANLKAIGCSDGDATKGVSCYRGCISMARHVRVPVTCWRQAASVDAARACGGIRCR